MKHCLQLDSYNSSKPVFEKTWDDIFSPVGLNGHLRRNESLSNYTTWRVGGPAQWFYEPSGLMDLAHLLRQVPEEMPIFWLGLGSNLLVRDGGLRGIVILTAGLLKGIQWLDDRTLHMEAGVSCAKAARLCGRKGLSGIEFLAGIPGTIGGALATNAGAWGKEIWSVVRGVETLDRRGRHHCRIVNHYDIGYRHIEGPKDEWFVATTLSLTPGSCEDSQAKIRELLKKRNQTQPTGLPSAGSVFRNPPGDYAARLIELDGWKGYCIGGACVSEKHANFIINQGTATAADIETLIKQIRTSVAQHYGIELIPEVHIVGEFSQA
jgi:UDP-N-acetylmuramate dehydrogenase